MAPPLDADLLRRLFEQAPIAVLVTDREGLLTAASPAFCALFGRAPAEVQGRAVLGLFHPEDRPRVAERLDRAREAGAEAPPVEARGIRGDGGELWVAVRCTALRDAGGAAAHGLVVLEDLTERRAAETERERLAAQMRQAQKMEAIGTLAGGIAHDFNNLLMGIQGNVSLLLMDKPADHRDVPYLRKIEASVERATALTRQILGFARGGKYDVRVTDLNALVAATVEMFGRTRPELSIALRQEAALWRIEADQTQIQQVLVNLLVNAWEAMPGGGALEVATANMALAADAPDKPPEAPPGNYVCVRVADTGVGMDAATQKRIFEPFFTTREKGRASGLGLSSAFGIVKGHSGFITVRSAPGRGSTFSVFLPAAAGAPPPAAPPPPEKGTVRTVLLVEDEAVVADIGEKMLARLGYRTLVAHSGEEALRLFAERHAEIDLVILDMIMPGMAGGAVFDRLRTIRPEAAVLLSSGYSLNGEAAQILKRGCRGFIQKPFSLAQLKQKIGEILPGG